MHYDVVLRVLLGQTWHLLGVMLRMSDTSCALLAGGLGLSDERLWSSRACSHEESQ